MQRRQFHLHAAWAAAALLSTPLLQAQALPAWEQITAQARGQTVFWNVWAGDEKTNAFIAWVGERVKASVVRHK
jgi:putative thiamine transport system substrate-binding protein